MYSLLVLFILVSGASFTMAQPSSVSVGSAAYYRINRCPTSTDQFSSPSYPTSGASECALACLLGGNCSVFNTDSGLSTCAMASITQVVSQWAVSDACGALYRAEMRDSKITGLWDFRLGLQILLFEGLTGSFALSGNSSLSSADGLVMTGGAADYAYLPAIAGTPFAVWENFTSANSSLFVRVRRYGNSGPTGYFSLHNCSSLNNTAISVFETLENRLILKTASVGGGTSVSTWTDSVPFNNETDYVTLGFVFNAANGNVTLWRNGQRSSVQTQFNQPTSEMPSSPLCVSLGAASYGARLHGSIRCLLVAKTAIDILVVNAAFIGC